VALRALKRRISDGVYQRLLEDMKHEAERATRDDTKAT
jgi:hypothetical protein